MTDAELEKLVEQIFLLVQDGQVAAAVEMLRKALKPLPPSSDAENGRKEAAGRCNRPDRDASNTSLPGVSPPSSDAGELVERLLDENYPSGGMLWNLRKDAAAILLRLDKDKAEAESAEGGHGEPCFYCGEPCNAFAGDPGLWPLGFAHKDGTGICRWHHSRCVIDRLEPGLGEGRATSSPCVAALRVRGYLKRAHEEAGVQEIELLDAKRQIRKLREALEKAMAKMLGTRKWDTHSQVIQEIRAALTASKSKGAALVEEMDDKQFDEDITGLRHD